MQAKHASTQTYHYNHTHRHTHTHLHKHTHIHERHSRTRTITRYMSAWHADAPADTCTRHTRTHTHINYTDTAHMSYSWRACTQIMAATNSNSAAATSASTSTSLEILLQAPWIPTARALLSVLRPVARSATWMWSRSHQRSVVKHKFRTHRPLPNIKCLGVEDRLGLLQRTMAGDAIGDYVYFLSLERVILASYRLSRSSPNRNCVIPATQKNLRSVLME
jgi:hypothetical protein